jgi:uncharacterized membrane protein
MLELLLTKSLGTSSTTLATGEVVISMDSELVVLTFDSPEAAEHGLETLRTLEAEGFLQIDDCALLSRDAQGWVTAKRADHDDLRRKATFGGVIGLFVGGVIGLPVLGVLAGAGGAARLKEHADRLEELIASVGNEMKRGSGVLAFTVASLTDASTVTDRLHVNRDGLVNAQIPAALRAEIERSLPD